MYSKEVKGSKVVDEREAKGSKVVDKREPTPQWCWSGGTIHSDLRTHRHSGL